MHTPAVIKPQMTDVGPPLGRAREREADNAVHELRMAKASPSIDNGEKCRCNSCLTPRDAKCSSSFINEARRPSDCFRGILGWSRDVLDRSFSLLFSLLCQRLHSQRVSSRSLDDLVLRSSEQCKGANRERSFVHHQRSFHDGPQPRMTSHDPCATTPPKEETPSIEHSRSGHLLFV